MCVLGVPQLAKCFYVDFWAPLPLFVLLKSSGLSSAGCSMSLSGSCARPGCRLGPAGSLPRGPLAREYLQTSAWAELASAVLLGQHATTSTMDCKAIVSTATANTSQTVYMQNFRCSELGA